MRLAIRNTAYAMPSNPPLLGKFFTNPALSIVWLIARLYLGWQWLEAGWGKLNNPAWFGSGTALKGFWASAVAVPAQGKPAITFDWYRSFLSALLAGGHYTWFAKVVTVGELAIGTALILGAFVGVAALFGAFMNMNFMLAGSASTNPIFFLLAVLLLLAWKVAGYWGLDRWLLPVLQTPWDRMLRRLERGPVPASPRKTMATQAS